MKRIKQLDLGSLSMSNVRSLLKAGTLVGEKISGMWYTTQDEIDKLKSSKSLRSDKSMTSWSKLRKKQQNTLGWTAFTKYCQQGDFQSATKCPITGAWYVDKSDPQFESHNQREKARQEIAEYLLGINGLVTREEMIRHIRDTWGIKRTSKDIKNFFYRHGQRIEPVVPHLMTKEEFAAEVRDDVESVSVFLRGRLGTHFHVKYLGENFVHPDCSWLAKIWYQSWRVFQSPGYMTLAMMSDKLNVCRRSLHMYTEEYILPTNHSLKARAVPLEIVKYIQASTNNNSVRDKRFFKEISKDLWKVGKHKLNLTNAVISKLKKYANKKLTEEAVSEMKAAVDEAIDIYSYNNHKIEPEVEFLRKLLTLYSRDFTLVSTYEKNTGMLGMKVIKRADRERGNYFVIRGEKYYWDEIE